MRKTALATVVTGLFVTFATSAAAETKTDRSFSVQRFLTVPGTDNFLTIDGARVAKHLGFTLGFMDIFQYKPLVVFEYDDGELGKERTAIIQFHDQLDLMASISLVEWIQIGLVIPFTVYQSGKGLDPETAQPGGGLESWGAIGDPRVSLKVRFLGKQGEDGVGLAFVPTLGLPIGGYGPWAQSFSGERMPTVHARIIVDYLWGKLHVALNVGYFFRDESLLYSTYVEDELTYGLGLSYRLHRNLTLMGEVFGGVGLTTRKESDAKGIFSGNNAQMPLELDGALRIHLKPIEITVGGGGGVIPAVGTPMFRVFLGLTWLPSKDDVEDVPVDDRDLDGKPNKEDFCPDEAEDYDEFEDADGCPEVDNDKDGINDGYDSCPLEPEDIDKFEDDDGCPDLDHDKDGVKSPDDQCEDEPEDVDGFKDEDGCPEPDNDGDGLADADDLCPDDAEDLDGFVDEDGCPEPDNDEDGIPDKDDKCPDKKEVFNGLEDDDGCPDKGKTLVVITKEKIEIKQQVNFATDSDEIVGDTSFQILDVVAAVLKTNPEIKIEIQGHTDNKGNYDHNVDLSQRRAESVMKYLVGKGVNPDNLTAKGYGPDVPIASNKNKKGQALNRRVEFHIKTADGGDGGESMPAGESETASEQPASDEGTGEADMTFDIPAE